MLFKYLKKEINKKLYQDLQVFFLIFQKGNKQKNCVRYFEIHKYAFLCDYLFSGNGGYRDIWGL